MVVDDRWFVKVISKQNSVIHALFTTGRNLGAFSSGTEGFFERFADPVEMAEHELAATERMRAVGLNAPKPIEAFEVDGLGVVVLEYLPEFRTLDELDTDSEADLAPALFATLRTMHRNDLVHGDLRAENVLIREGEIYLIDATSVAETKASDATAYDIACALGALEPLIGGQRTVSAALTAFSADELLAAARFLDFVNIRPDHDFDAAVLHGEIEKRASSP
jgi:RIO-like serine/threonine protein kinase